MVLNRNVAPVAVARFLEAVGRGYYTNSVIYRDDENVTVFGNPSANDEGGWPRFARDEPGTSIEWMTLTLQNHGPDTADGRLALRWRPNPELDRRETVIGRAHIPSLPGRHVGVLDALQLGKLIQKIVVGGEGRIERTGPRDPCYPFKSW